MKRLLQNKWFWLIGLVIILLTVFWPRTAGDPPPGQRLAPNSSERSAGSEMAEFAPEGTEFETPIDVPAQTHENDSTLLNEQARNAWYGGDLRTAMALFEQAIAAGPDNPVPHTNFGRLLTLMVVFDRAIPLLEHSRDLQPENVQAWLDLATAYERAQLFSKSWEAQAEAGKLVGASSVTRDARGRFVVTGTTLDAL